MSCPAFQAMVNLNGWLTGGWLQVLGRKVDRFNRALCGPKGRPKGTKKEKGQLDPVLEAYLRAQKCYLCGGKGGGIDRLDSNGTYEDIANLRPCCEECNMLKNAMPLKYVKSQVARIYGPSCLGTDM